MALRFIGGDRIQRGRGVGGLLRLASKLFSPVARVVKNVLRSNTGKLIGNAVKEQAVESSINVVSDIAKGRNIKESLKDEIHNVKHNAKRKALEIGVSHLKNFSSESDKFRKKKKTTPKKKLNGKLKRPTSFHNIRRSWQGSELDISGKSPGHMEV